MAMARGSPWKLPPESTQISSPSKKISGLSVTAFSSIAKAQRA